jgi:hypothetical protein
MTTVLKVSLKDLNLQFIKDIQKQYGLSAEVEIRVSDDAPPGELLLEDTFWQIIDLIDWSKKVASDKLLPAAERLAAMPVSHIYLFADKLSEKLYLLDTREHANAYAINEPDGFVSADDFLYARCAVVAEGKEYYESVLAAPSSMPDDIVFEPLLNLPALAWQIKMGEAFDYRPAFNYETHSNKPGWN